MAAIDAALRISFAPASFPAHIYDQAGCGSPHDGIKSIIIDPLSGNCLFYFYI
ncbi:MAG: hypothetical protein ACLUD0_14560 [Eubacterium ramulus]